MQKRYSNKFVAIISACFLLLAAFIIDINVEVRPSYARVNETKYSQHRPNNREQRPPNFWWAPPHNAEKNFDNEKIWQIFGVKETPRQNLSVKEINRQINSFFAYLDQQEYIKEYKFAQDSKSQLNQIIEILTQNSPVLIRETDSIYDVLKNYYYFYRLIGKKRLNFIKDILTNESDIIEPLMYTFYLWFSANNENSDPDLVRPSFEQMYIYANFFLETIGGRNYLFRRDPKARKLASYYCVLIIDQANMDGLNSNGTDIRPHLELTIKDLANQIDLSLKNQYLWELENLRKKYKLS